MKRSILTLSVAMVALTVGACAGGDEGADTTLADTSTMRGMDTVQVPTTVPTTDTVVRQTQVTVDTLQGQARDTTRRTP